MNLNDLLQKHKTVIFASLAIMGAGALIYNLYLELTPSSATTTTHTGKTHTSPQINDTASHPEPPKPPPPPPAPVPDPFDPLDSCLKRCQGNADSVYLQTCRKTCMDTYAPDVDIRPKADLKSL